jgi:hypothetical protein
MHFRCEKVGKERFYIEHFLLQQKPRASASKILALISHLHVIINVIIFISHLHVIINVIISIASLVMYLCAIPIFLEVL